MMIYTTTELAPAKINLGLAVKKRMDDGYHWIETIFQSISLSDRLQVDLKGQGIICECGELSGEHNLAFLAAQKYVNAFENKTGRCIESGIAISIEKNIPMQAGLAGGSSDAAAVIRALNRLLQYPFTYEELLMIASDCGSDTAFCLKGGTQWGEGRGTFLKELPPVPTMDLLLVKPDKGVNTKQAYQLFSEQGEFGTLDKEYWHKIIALGEIEKIGKILSNSLEKTAIKLVPEILEIKKLLIQEECCGALMSGSGSAIFGILKNRQHGVEIGKKLSRKGFSNYWIVNTIGANTL